MSERFEIIRTDQGWQVRDTVTGHVTLPVAIRTAAEATRDHFNGLVSRGS